MEQCTVTGRLVWNQVGRSGVSPFKQVQLLQWDGLVNTPRQEEGIVHFVIQGGIVVLVAVSLSACSVPFMGGVPRVSGATPEDVAQQHVPQLGRPAPTNVRVHGTRNAARDTCAIHGGNTKPRRGAQPPNMGYVLTEQHGTRWQATESTYGASVAEAGQLAEYRSGTFGGSGSHAWIVYGRVLNPAIVAVETTFDTGQVVRDAVTGEMFGVVAAAATTVCDVRLLDAQGRVVQQLDPAQSRTTPPDTHARAARCPAR